jgi:nucleotide-binding universal stress UspA family protein
MKNILLPLQADAGQEARLQIALDAARMLDGHLECVEVRGALMPMKGDFGGEAAALALVAFREAEQARQEARARIEQRLMAEDVRWSFTDTCTSLADALADNAALADLIIISGRLGEADETASIHPQPLPLRLRRPLLAVPPSARALALDRGALVAWDRSRPALEAVRAAVPLLARSAAVTILEVDAPSEAIPMEAIALYLSRYGIMPDLVQRRSQSTVAATLRDQVQASNAGLLVMGAYGSLPLAQAIFGGVTRTMLATSPVPLLLAH